MFSIEKMCGASDWYLLSVVRYYLRRRNRKARKRRGPAGTGEDDTPDDDVDPDESPFGDITPYTIDMPGEKPGQWFGAGSIALGLSGMIRENDYHCTFRGYHPLTGQRLVQNAGKPDRCAGFEGCFSPIKDLSVLWSQCPPDVRKRIEELNWRVVQDTLRMMGRSFAFSRVGKASEGCEHVPVGLVIAMFEHGSTRAKDPDLHIHTQIFNIGVDSTGCTRSIDSSPIFRNQRLFTAYYRAALAAGLRTEFGLITEVDRDGIRIRGIPRELVKQYSKRRKAILDYLAERGESGAAAAARAALATRDKKDPLVSRQELFELWQTTNVEAGFDDKYVARLLRHGPRMPKGNIQKVIKVAVRDLTRQTSHFSRSDLVYSVLTLLPKYGLSPSSVWHEIDEYLAHDPQVVPLGSHDGELRYTTQRILDAERRLLHAADLLSNRPGNTLHAWEVERELKKHPTLRPEQVDFVRHLTQTNSALRIALGLAGTGKTYALKVFVDACKRRGLRVLVAAPTGQATRVLGNETGIEGETLTKLLGDFKLPISAVITHHAHQFICVVRRRRTRRFRQPIPVTITPGTIVIIDESGMKSLPHATKLMELVEQGGGTLCLIGDPAQMPAIDSVAPLQALARRYGATRLTDIRRQRQIWARVAARVFADADPGEAMEIFASRNRITVRDTVDEAIKQACLDWTEEGLLTPHRAIILTNTNALAHTTNQLCQQHRLQAGTIQRTPSIRITDEQEDAVYESQANVGDRVLFTQNSRGRRGYGVDNGSLGTVMAVNPSGSRISVSLDDGRRVRVDTIKFPHIRLGYAMTTHKAQGASIPKVYILIAGNANLQNLPASYVQATRAVEDMQFYTTKNLLDLLQEDIKGSPLVKQMSRRPDLRLACELLEEAPLELRPRKLSIRGTPEPVTEEHAAATATPGVNDGEPTDPASLCPGEPTDSPEEPNAQEQQPEQEQQPQRPDDAQSRSTAYRTKQLQAKRQAWETHDRQQQADALERERLTAQSDRRLRHEKRKALRTKQAAQAQPSPQETGDLSSGDHADAAAAAAQQCQGDANHVNPTTADQQEATSVVREAQPPAAWQPRLVTRLQQDITAATFRLKKDAIRRQREGIKQQSQDPTQASGDNSDSSVAASDDSAQLPTSQPTQDRDAWEHAYRTARAQSHLRERQESLHLLQEAERLGITQPARLEAERASPIVPQLGRLPASPGQAADSQPVRSNPSPDPTHPLSGSPGDGRPSPPPSRTPSFGSESTEATFSAANGYQRLRIPAGERSVRHGFMILASCVDGGSTEHRDRPPPPPGHPMPYASDCIHVQRIVPVPSRYMTLAHASRGRYFRLEGTGCQDYVRVVCEPYEVWMMKIDGPLGLISPQDDIAGAVTLYSRPEILCELTRLDEIQTQIRQILPVPTLLLSLFACLRREISWLLPKAADPAAVSLDHLRRSCRMLFQDTRTQDFFDWFQTEFRPIEERLLGGSFHNAMANLHYHPPQPMLDALGRAITLGQPCEPHYQDCIHAIERHFPDRQSQQELRDAIHTFDTFVQNARQLTAAHQPLPPQKQTAVMQVLYEAAGLALPADASFHPLLTNSFQLEQSQMKAFPPAHYFWLYATASIRGREADAKILHATLIAETKR